VYNTRSWKNILKQMVNTKDVFDAARRGDIRAMQRYLDTGEVNLKWTYGFKTLLETAAENGKLDMVRFLLKKGAPAFMLEKFNLYPPGPAADLILFSQPRFYDKPVLFEPKGGRKTTRWMEICNQLDKVAGVSDLQEIAKVSEGLKDFVSTLTGSSFSGQGEFEDFIRSLNKRQVCALLARYYDIAKNRLKYHEAVKRSNFPNELGKLISAKTIQRAYMKHLYPPDKFLKTQTGRDVQCDYAARSGLFSSGSMPPTLREERERSKEARKYFGTD
jgi:hypothetical protein